MKNKIRNINSLFWHLQNKTFDLLFRKDFLFLNFNELFKKKLKGFKTVKTNGSKTFHSAQHRFQFFVFTLFLWKKLKIICSAWSKPFFLMYQLFPQLYSYPLCCSLQLDTNMSNKMTPAHVEGLETTYGMDSAAQGGGYGR